MERLKNIEESFERKVALFNAKTLKPYSVLNKRIEMIPVFV